MNFGEIYDITIKHVITMTQETINLHLYWLLDELTKQGFNIQRKIIISTNELKKQELIKICEKFGFDIIEPCNCSIITDEDDANYTLTV